MRQYLYHLLHVKNVHFLLLFFLLLSSWTGWSSYKLSFCVCILYYFYILCSFSCNPCHSSLCPKFTQPWLIQALQIHAFQVWTPTVLKHTHFQALWVATVSLFLTTAFHNDEVQKYWAGCDGDADHQCCNLADVFLDTWAPASPGMKSVTWLATTLVSLLMWYTSVSAQNNVWHSLHRI